MNKKYSKQTLALAAKIAASVFETISKEKNVDLDTAFDSIDASREMVDDYMKKAARKFKLHQSAADGQVKTYNEQISNACKRVDAAFHSASMAEVALAKMEGREVSTAYLRRIAKRITVAAMKDVPGVDVSSITVNVKRRKNGSYIANVTISADNGK